MEQVAVIEWQIFAHCKHPFDADKDTLARSRLDGLYDQFSVAAPATPWKFLSTAAKLPR